jgi:hypothetical protein
MNRILITNAEIVNEQNIFSGDVLINKDASMPSAETWGRNPTTW